MKIFLIFFLFLSLKSSAQRVDNTHENTPNTNSKSFPKNFSEVNFKELYSLQEQIIAFDGVIEEIREGESNTPSYLLRIGEDKQLWTVLMFDNERNKKGDTIRVVGYVSEIKKKKHETDYLNGRYMVIVFGLVDFKNSNFLFAHGAEKQKKEWVEGKIPQAR